MKRRLAWLAVVVAALCLGGCASQVDRGLVTSAETSYREEKVQLPEGSFEVYDLCATERNGLSVAVGNRDHTKVDVLARTDTGAWESVFGTAGRVPALDEGGYPVACLTPQGRLLCGDASAEAARATCVLVGEEAVAETALMLDAGATRMRMYDDDTVFVAGGMNDSLERFDVATGDRRCSYKLSGDEFLADYTVHEGLVYVVTSRGGAAQVEYAFSAYDADSGEQRDIDPALKRGLDATLPSSGGIGFASIAIAGGADGLYVCSKGAVFRCSADGAERVMDGAGTHLENENQTPMRLVVLPEGGFAIEYRDAASATTPLSAYRYVEGERPEPASTLTVYSLEESADLQQAVAMFRDVRPDVAIELKVGIPAGSALTVDDAVRALNADLLAGTGPDVLVLDGLPIDQLIAEGMLLDVGDVLDAAAESADYFENVLTAFSTDAGCFAVPTRFAVPAMAGESSALAHAGSLADMVAYFDESDDARIRLNSFVSVSALYLASYPSLLDDEGAVDGDALAAFFDDAKRLVDIGEGNVSDAADPAHDRVSVMFENFGAGGYSNSLSGSALLFNGETRFAFGLLQGLSESYGSVGVAMANVDYPCSFDLMAFDGARAYQPRTIAGVSAESGDSLAAKEFVGYLLGAEHQSQVQNVGLPVSRTVFEEGLRAYGGYGIGFMDEERGMVEFSCDAPTESEIAAYADALARVDVPCVFDKVVTDAVAEGLEAYCRDEAALDDAVAAAKQRIDLYRAQ